MYERKLKGHEAIGYAVERVVPGPLCASVRQECALREKRGNSILTSRGPHTRATRQNNLKMVQHNNLMGARSFAEWIVAG